MLDRFLFPPEKQYSLLGKLSGGEKRRLNLLRVLMEAPNVLILDEPTNDLDIRTLTILEDYLDRFDGIVIAVSHDRYFLDRVVRRIFAFENGTINQYEGGYTDYQLRKAYEEQEKEQGQSVSSKVDNKATTDNDKSLKQVKNRQEKLKFSYKEQREYEAIDDDIATLEAKIADLDEQMLKNASDYGKLNKLTQEKTELEEKLEEKMDRWVYLQDLAERIGMGE
jgi:ATP-binding cassette subfamily F protein uup